jgi:hypothetical protein
VPLWGIAGSLYKIAFSPEIANIEAAITSCGEEEITIAFANSGKLDGIVTDVNFFLLQDGKRSKPDVKVRPTNGLSNIVISPNKPPVLVIYKAYIGDTETKFISKSQGSRSCFLVFEINWVDFKGSKKQISREWSCPQ